MGCRFSSEMRPVLSAVPALARQYGLTPDDLTSALAVVSYEAGRVECSLRADVTQAGLVGLLKALPKFDRTRGFSLSTFAAKHIRGEIKRLLSQGAAELPLYADGGYSCPEPVASGLSPDDCCMAPERNDAVRRFVGGLPRRLRWLVTRLFWDGASQADAGREIGVSRTAVSKMMDRVRRRGRRPLAGHVPDGWAA